MLKSPSANHAPRFVPRQKFRLTSRRRDEMIPNMETARKFGGTLPETTELERGIHAEHVRLANEINKETIAAQQQEISRLRSLALARNMQVGAESELVLAAVAWLWEDRDQLVFGDMRLDTLLELETSKNFAQYVARAGCGVDDLLPRYECEGCHDPKCGFKGYLCAEDAQPPEIVRARKMPLRFKRASARAAEIRERIAGIEGGNG